MTLSTSKQELNFCWYTEKGKTMLKQAKKTDKGEKNAQKHIKLGTCFTIFEKGALIHLYMQLLHAREA